MIERSIVERSSRGPQRRLVRAGGPALAACVPAVLLLAGCTHRVKVEPIQVEPIYITVDVRLQMERELDEFFEFENRLQPPAEESQNEQGGPA